MPTSSWFEFEATVHYVTHPPALEAAAHSVSTKSDIAASRSTSDAQGLRFQGKAL